MIFPGHLKEFKIQGPSSSVHHTSYSLIPAPKRRRRLLYYNWNSIVYTMSKCAAAVMYG